MEKLLVTPEEAADALSIGRSTVYELLRMGVLESVHIGRCRRISSASIRRFVEYLAADHA